MANKKTNKNTLSKSNKTNSIKINKYQTSLAERWAFAMTVLLTPGSVVAFLITIGLFVYTKTQEGPVRITLEIFEIISSSVFTAIIVQNIIDARGDNAVAKKSVASIRYLQSLKYKVKNVADRVKSINKRGNRDLDEILNLISNIDKDILNSISDWADINPASIEIVDFFEEMRLKEDDINKLTEEVVNLNEQKDRLDKDKGAEIKKLEANINKKESRISELQQRISDQSLSNISISSGTLLSSAIISPSYSVNTCKRCGSPLSLMDAYDTNSNTEGLCYRCKNTSQPIRFRE